MKKVHPYSGAPEFKNNTKPQIPGLTGHQNKTNNSMINPETYCSFEASNLIEKNIA